MLLMAWQSIELTAAQLEERRLEAARLPLWFDDYNRCHQHRGLKMKSPREFRTAHS
ncbi:MULTISPECIES: hypothetical protein [Myxococcus]|uniref:hypothetical protein n=1 Tax=Myxococcus TaxID=32 RepID=UPI00129C55F1|nr:MULTISPECIES: hypothetical protein [Myxococcus]NOK00034.1 hypothetical protein [Myxococcus xanthus]